MVTQKETIKNKLISSETWNFVLLLLITLAVKSFLSPIFFSVFLYITLVLFLVSKNSWFWILYAFVLTFDVGGFFGAVAYRIDFISSFDTYYFIWFSIFAFIKSTRRKMEGKYLKLFTRQFHMWIGFGIFLFIYGIFVFGLSDFLGRSGFRYYWTILNGIAGLLLFYSLPRLFKSYDNLLRLSEVIFILVYINIIGQFYEILTGNVVYIQLGFREVETARYGVSIFANERIIRPEWGSNIRFIALFLALLFYLKNEKKFNKNFLLVTIISILFSTFITATRGWTIAFLFILLSSMFITKKATKMMKVLALSTIIALFTILFSNVVRTQIFNVIERLATLEALAEGDLTAEGTLSRLTSRSEPLMDEFYKYPLLGVGLSGKGLALGDRHVGNQNILMGEGVIGMILYISIVTSLFVGFIKINKSLLPLNPFRNAIQLIVTSLLGLIIIHSSSQAFIGWIIFLIRPQQLMFLSVLFLIYNIILTEALNYNYFLQNSRQNLLKK